MDVLFDLTDAPERRETPEERLPSYVVGTMTRALEVRQAGSVDFLGVRFRPGGITPFVPIPADDVTDGVVALDDVWGGRAREIRTRLQEIRSIEARVAVVDGILRERLRKAPAADEVVRAAADFAQRSGGRVAVDDLAHATGLGRRQLERRFLAVVGVSPKTACRVLRFQGALARLTAAPTMPLSRVALESGYHDQAHFTREFKALAGVPPGAYRSGLVTPPGGS